MFGAIGTALGTIFGSKAVVEKGLDLIDESFESAEEKTDNEIRKEDAKTKRKVDLLNAYAPFKVAQRVLAFMFSGVFIFILLNGVLGSLYGWVNMENVKEAVKFADTMYLGEIVLVIVTFYFGGGLKESWDRKRGVT